MIMMIGIQMMVGSFTLLPLSIAFEVWEIWPKKNPVPLDILRKRSDSDIRRVSNKA